MSKDESRGACEDIVREGRCFKLSATLSSKDLRVLSGTEWKTLYVQGYYGPGQGRDAKTNDTFLILTLTENHNADAHPCSDLVEDPSCRPVNFCVLLDERTWMWILLEKVTGGFRLTQNAKLRKFCKML